jgi:hypothetical protein
MSVAERRHWPGWGEGGYMAKPRRRRASGSLASLKKALWATITYNLDVVEDGALDHELKQRACNSMTQAALAYAKVIEIHEQSKAVEELDRLADGNGHRR